MTPTHEQYRPDQFAGVLGNECAVKALAMLCRDRGLGGRAVWIAGASGTGKTTLARIAARTLADDFWVEEYDSADDLTVGELNRIRDSMQLTAGGKGGRVWIVNEAHGLSARITRALLGLLERLPSHCAVVFTTTNDGQQTLFEGIDGGPLLSRCKPIHLSNQGLAPVFAERLREVAALEGYDVPLAKAKRIVQDNRNNMRAAYEWLGSPESMDFLTDDAAVLAA